MATGKESIWNVVQQPIDQGLILPAGTTFRYFANNMTNSCQVIGIDKETEDNIPASKIRVLNSSEEYVVPNSTIVPANSSDHLISCSILIIWIEQP